ncbi:MAG: hypothetical protein R3B55_02790 [Candidatus Paceibacterota bacterium]
MAYKIDSRKFFLSLELSKLKAGEGDKALNDFKKVLIGKFDLTGEHLTVLIELVKNIIDHSDKGYLFLRQLDNGCVEFLVKSRSSSFQEEERRARRSETNRSLGMRLVADLCLDERYKVVSVFSAHCFRGLSPRDRKHHFSGRFIPDGDNDKNT